ncbi:MAG: nucleoside deaminase [Zetaproteobacteria bacterium]|nr:nucleoside deaminase [Zetaproteobacteria bacterium]
MEVALQYARWADTLGEVPVGAVIVKNNRIVSTGMNEKETYQNVVLHAEIVAIQKACSALGSWRLDGCELYVTLEPCLMCAGAIYQSRIQRVVYATTDPKAGAMGSLYTIHQDTRLNHRLEVCLSSPHQEEASQLLKNFFKKRRKNKTFKSCKT